jgi:hypothetical protein
MSLRNARSKQACFQGENRRPGIAENPVPVLDVLPDEILNRMLDYTRQYRPDRTVTNYGALPTSAQVDAARRWIEDRQDPTRHTRVREPSDWDRYQMEARILQILDSAPTHPSHEAGRFFMTPYQIAIEFARRYNDDFRRMGRPIGGAGAGDNSLTKYIATQLSQRIKAGKLRGIEQQFLFSADVKAFTFEYEDSDIVATPNEAEHPNSMYRLRQDSPGEVVLT